MAVTTVEEQIKRLRSYLNPFIKGPTVDAVLTALATGNAAPLINNIRSVNDQLYIATASGKYLDERLSQFGITRPPAVGLSDDIFRQIGIEVKNRKQVRDLINNLLSAIFGDEAVRASNPARTYEPYNLQDGDILIVNFDDRNTIPIEFKSAEFTSIAAATAQEVADAITKTLRTLGFNGTAIAKDDGNGPFVELLSDTIGASSSVTVLGGRAQNVLKFDAPVMGAGGNMSTQWTISSQSGGVMRFTWSAGANPHLGLVNTGNYVNIFGGGFTSSSNEGSYTILTSVGGTVGSSYFEIENPLGTSGIIIQGTDDALLFYNPIRKTIASRLSYAAAYQTSARLLQIFMPAATKVVRRDRIGSAHLHDPPNGIFTFEENPNPGDQFSVTTTNTFIADTDFVVAATVEETAQNLADAINSNIPEVVAIAGVDPDSHLVIVTIWQDFTIVTLTVLYTGAQDITGSGLLGDVVSLEPDQLGPYMYNLSQPFTISEVGTLLDQDLDGTMSRLVQVADASQFPDERGFLILGYGTENQEGPIPYIARPSSTTLLISPIYTISKTHPAGSDVALVSENSSAVLNPLGTDYQFYITDVVSGRLYAQDLINAVVATGINVVFTILYPSDIGLGKWDTIYSENPLVWGGDDVLPAASVPPPDIGWGKYGTVNSEFKDK